MKRYVLRRLALAVPTLLLVSVIVFALMRFMPGDVVIRMVEGHAYAPTVEALKALGPKLIVPSHCTGWRAVHEIARALPDAFVPNSVGTTFLIGAN